VGALLLSRSPRALFRGLYQDRGKILLGVGVIFGMLVVLSGLVSRGVTRPSRRSAAPHATSPPAGAPFPETPATAAVEIRALYGDFRVMAEAIARRSRYLRDFAAAVSHEFKTPLAGITGAVELLEDHHAEMSEAERRRFLGNISADSARLSQLVTRLLDLARADMALPESGAATELGAPLARVADAQRGRELQVELDLAHGLPSVRVPGPTLETVLGILIENSRQAGASNVRVSARARRDAVAVRVSDNGPGVPVADRERLFEPFFTSRRAQGGTGLGLPIARSLLAASHADITILEPGAEGGASFELVLPTRPAPGELA
jgi:signal transduction histidine kinase